MLGLIFGLGLVLLGKVNSVLDSLYEDRKSRTLLQNCEIKFNNFIFWNLIVTSF